MAAKMAGLVKREVTLVFGVLSITILSPHMDRDEVQVEGRALDYSVAEAREQDESNRNYKDRVLASSPYLSWNQSLKKKEKIGSDE